MRYDELIENIRQCVYAEIPTDAKVLIASKGDQELLKLKGRTGQHFPQREDGVYAGFYPADSAAAIEHLETLREKGTDYFLLPNTAFWWLDFYPEFKRHLEQNYQEVSRQKESCLIFRLRALEIGDKQPDKDCQDISYRNLLERIRQIVKAVLPSQAVVLVVSGGEDELLKLNGCKAQHFPHREDEIYKGNNTIEQLEMLRANGAEYLIIPQNVFRWFGICREFRRHIETRYSLVARQKYSCLIYKL